MWRLLMSQNWVVLSLDTKCLGTPLIPSLLTCTLYMNVDYNILTWFLFWQLTMQWSYECVCALVVIFCFNITSLSYILHLLIFVQQCSTNLCLIYAVITEVLHPNPRQFLQPAVNILSSQVTANQNPALRKIDQSESRKSIRHRVQGTGHRHHSLGVGLQLATSSCS